MPRMRAARCTWCTWQRQYVFDIFLLLKMFFLLLKKVTKRLHILCGLGFAAICRWECGELSNIVHSQAARIMSNCSVESSIAVLQSFSLSLVQPFVLFMGQCKWLLLFFNTFQIISSFLLLSIFLLLFWYFLWCAMMCCDALSCEHKY